MKRKSIIIIIIGTLAVSISAYIYLHFLKANIPEAGSQSKTPIDLRPLIISKLQQLVKESSEGLYKLSIEKLEPDVLQSKIDVFNASLVPDTAALQRLNKELKAPDDVFKISFSSVHITGLGILDFLHKGKIDLDTVYITDPIVEVFHKRRAYNEAKRQTDSALTFYESLTQHFRSISMNAIVAKQGTLITKNLLQKNSTRKFNQVNIRMSKLLIDSSTQYDKNRFLFSKEVELSTKDYVSRTSDSLYLFKIASISVLATKHTMIAKKVALEPRGTRQQFQKKLQSRADMFTVKFPEVVCNNIDWWALANGDGFYSEVTHAYNGFVGDYFNRTLPPGREQRKDNFPQQILMRVSQKINIKKLHIHKLKLSYEEYSPQSMQSGKVYFNNINATLNNVTNMPISIKTNKLFNCFASGFFMHQIPVTAHFQFNLSKAHTGQFSADLHVGAMDKTIINSIAEPLGMFTLKSGTLQQATAHIRGDNFKAKATMVMLYNDLHVTPLKNPDSTGNLKKKTVADFFANTFFIKDANPSPGESLRNPEVIVQRDGSGSFFNFLWKAIFTASAKTIGIPHKFVE